MLKNVFTSVVYSV